MKPTQVHDSAEFHVRGTSRFVDDEPILPGELQVGLLTSPLAHAKIKKLDFKKALSIPGVAGIFTAKDLQKNLWGSIFEDQPLLAHDLVQFHGEPIAVIAADDLDTIRQAQREIVIEFEELNPVLDIDRAIEQELFIGPERKIERGDFEKAWLESDHHLEDSITIPGQDHFYLESQASLAYPGEGDQIEILSSSQHPTEVQHIVAHALGIPYHQVVCRVRRIGGAFGGKESQAAPFATFAALVAHRLKRPARMVLCKDDDMQQTGKRNPFKIFYRAGFTKDGMLQALEAKLYSDGGAFADLSTAIMERAMLHSDNAYYLPHARIIGQVCKTHTAPNTAFRGFGGPKGVLMIESLMEDIAQVLQKDAAEVRRLNVYGSRPNTDTTHYGQRLEENPLPQMLEQILDSSDYQKRRKEITQHNLEAQSSLRGLSVTAVKFGISFTTRFLNQGNALVNLHRDGTLQVSTGATEMGQGVNTKIAKIVAEVFVIDPKQVRIMETSTEKNHNTSATAASSGSDINGAAAQMAAVKIRHRLDQVAHQMFERPVESRGKIPAATGTIEEIEIEGIDPQVELRDGQYTSLKNSKAKAINWIDVIEEAFHHRISLGEYGFFRYPEIHFNKETGQGNPFYYFTHGWAVSEVAIDRYTGELKVLRSDLLMDLGRMINEGVDRGQTIGGFIQGMGWLTTERLYYSDRGELLSHSPSTYKIPGIHDIPRELKVDFIENSAHQKNVRASKAVGEPPLLLGISVWTAAKDALRSASNDSPVVLKIPASQEECFRHVFF